MNDYYGDFQAGSVIRIKFNTLDQSLVPTTPSIAPTFAVYKNSTAEHTADIVVTPDYDGKAGLHLVVIDTSANTTFFLAGEDYDLVFTAGTVDGKDLTRVKLKTFSLENRNIKANVTQVAGQPANAAAAVTFPASVASETTLGSRPTLVQIEGSTILAKEVTVAARATQTSVDGKPNLTQIEGSTILAKEATVAARATQASVDGKPTLAQIEGSTVLAKEATVAARATQASVDGKPTLAQIEGSTILAKEATVATVRDRIGAFAGTGVNTILGFLRALMRKDNGITTPSDIEGNFSHTTDSLEAIRDRGDAAWTTGAGGGGGGVDPWATDLPAGNYTSNQAGGIIQSVLAKTNTIQSGKVSYAGPVTAKGTVDQIVIGDDYLSAHGTAFVWTISAIPGMSVGTATVHFGGKNGTNPFAVTGTAADIGSGKWSLTCEMPKATSGGLVPGEYRYSVAVHNAAGVELTRVYYEDPFVAVEKFTP
jgi:hypothetical protein